ncbi:MAG: hypothetical protein HKP25_04115 [Marinicaulis sp.]|nr:hypothetical protein [Marinicaulis sp.]
MKSSAPWSVKGIERDARETAKEAAKREGMTVGEWLNTMIYNAGDAADTDGEVEGLRLKDIVTAIERLNKRLADAEGQNSETLNEINRNLGGAVERVQRLERVKPADGSYDDLADRMAKIEAARGDRDRIDALKALEKAVAQVAVQFNTAQKTSLDRIDANERQMQELAARLDNNVGADADASGVNFLKTAVDGLSMRISRIEKSGNGASVTDDEFVERTSNRIRVLGDEIKRGGDQIRAVETQVAKLSEQIDAAERRSAEGIEKIAETIAGLRDQFSQDTDRDLTRAEIDAAITAANQDTDERFEELHGALNKMISKIDALAVASPQAAPERPASESTGAVDIEDQIEALAEDGPEDENIEPENELDEIAPDLEAAFDYAEDDTGGDMSEPAVTTSDAQKTESELETGVEDPFAFADEIDDLSDLDEPSETATQTDETLESEADPEDDFSFEFEDDVPESAAAAGEEILAEVQQAFSDDGDPAANKKSEGDDGADNSSATTDEKDINDELDELLAELDQVENSDEPEAPPMFGPGKQAAGAPVDEKPADDTKEENDKEADAPQDYLKAARNRAKEAAARAAEEEENDKPKRRKLTAKQRAILAARAKQKRAEAGDDKAAKNAAAKKALLGDDAAEPKTSADTGDDDNDEQSGGLFSKIKAKLPFIGGAKDDETGDKTQAEDAPAQAAATDEINENERRRNGDREAFNTLKNAAAGNRVAVGLGLGIILAAIALFFLVKDFIAGSPSNEAAPVASTETTAATPELTTSQTVALPEVPGVPTIDPQILYTDAMAALSAAGATGDASEAIGKLQEAAALGHPPAQLQLGELYKTGQGVEQDLSRARTWFRRSANGGNVLAMHRIGVMTARGDGGAADPSEAIGWFELAGNRGLVDSQYNLGAIYHPSEDGAASPLQDAGKAYYWYSLAAKNGDEQAPALAAGVAGALSADQRAALDAEIASWEAEASDAAANEIASIE